MTSSTFRFASNTRKKKFKPDHLETIMATRTQEFWAVADTDKFGLKRGEFEIRLLNWDPSDTKGYMLIRSEPCLLNIDVPDEFCLQQAQAKAIKEEIQKVQAEAQNRITELTAHLNSILAIEA